MGKLFGTDGIRGVVGENLTVDLAFQVGRALTTVLAEEKKHRLTIAIGKDTRISSDMLEAALMAGICAAGGDVMPFGTIPTPAVAYLTVLEKADAGIVISASHNPYEHNGIKIFDSRGYKLSDEMEERIEELILSGAPMADKTRGEIGRRFHGMRQMKQLYVQHLLSSVDCDLTGMRALVDCANGAASATAPMLFDSLHLQADFIHCDPDGVNINRGAGSTHIDGLRRFVVENHLDVGFAYDGDADRCLAVDENGEVVDGDKIIYIFGCQMKREGRLAGNKVVTTVMSNFGLYKALDEVGVGYEKTAVGDRFVYENMAQNGYCVGGEQSGHIILSKYATTGDGILTSIELMEAMLDSKQTLSRLAAPVAVYPQVLKNVRVSDKAAVRENAHVQQVVQAVGERLGDTGRVLLRESGTEPVIRVMAEAQELRTAEACVNEMIEAIKAEGLA